MAQDSEAAMTTELVRPHRDESTGASTQPDQLRRPVTYVVLPDIDRPFLLARVRWPDVYQAISPVRADWQDDPGLFDLPYAPASVHVSYDEAAAIADGWGATLPSEDEQRVGPSLIRRMPSDWYDLSTAERRAWSVEIDKSARQAMAAASVRNLLENEGEPGQEPASGRRWWRRRRVQPALAGSAPSRTFAMTPDDENLIIDLAEAEAASVAAEPA